MFTYQDCIIDITSEDGYFYYDIYLHNGEHVYGYDSELEDYQTYGAAYFSAVITAAWITECIHSRY